MGYKTAAVGWLSEATPPDDETDLHRRDEDHGQKDRTQKNSCMILVTSEFRNLALGHRSVAIGKIKLKA